MVNDVDAHEMVPAHLWGATFGAASGRIAELCEVFLGKLGGNDFVCRELDVDALEATEEAVWQVRGVRAPGASDLTRRLQVMNVMGVERQLVFPSYALFAAQLVVANEFAIRDRMELTDPLEELRSLGREGLAEHNEWAVRTTALDPGRLRCVGYVLPLGSVEELIDETEALIDKGIRGLHLPAGTPPAGLSPADERLDPFWALLADRDVPLVPHVGGESGFVASSAWARAAAFRPGKVQSHEIGLEPFSMATVHLPVSTYLTAMVLGGVFERHPDLRFGAIEVGAGWLGPLADNLDMWAGTVHRDRLRPFLSMPPSAYLARNVRVTPYNDIEPIELYLERYPHLASCYCYATDYPHIEGGKDSLARATARIAHLGHDVVEQFITTNGELLLP